MFSSQLTEEVRLVQEDIDMVAAKIDSPLICQKIEQYVNAPFEIQTMFRKDAGKSCIKYFVCVWMPPSNVSDLKQPKKGSTSWPLCFARLSRLSWTELKCKGS